MNRRHQPSIKSFVIAKGDSQLDEFERSPSLRSDSSCGRRASNGRFFSLSRTKYIPLSTYTMFETDAELRTLQKLLDSGFEKVGGRLAGFDQSQQGPAKQLAGFKGS